MSTSASKYSFLPWVRRGISNNITSNPSGRSRAGLSVKLTFNGTDVSKTVLLIGPGDITGINSNEIVRTEPRNWITDFEPNYLAFIEFYDEDFPWRYSPTFAGNHKLSPWLHLLILKEEEFERTTMAQRPLTSIKLLADPSEVFPDPSQTWAWSHVHANSEITSNETVPDNSSLDSLIESNPDIAFSRLFGSRMLEEKSAYFAFLIPSFETGRLAGLGSDVPDTMDALTSSWSLNETPGKEYPVYYEWYFSTGTNGDFEYLVSLLEPRVMDSRIGIRDMDTHEPDFGLDDLSENAIVGLEGALRAPTTESRGFSDINDKTKFETQVEEIINLQEDLKANGNSQEPIVSPPFYGQWHALVERLSIDPSDENWVNNLSKDPRNRTASGLGTRVIQKHQEKYVRTAWEEVGDILTANQKIRFTQLAMNVSESIYSKDIVSLGSDSLLQITSPVNKKIMGSPATIYKQIKDSKLPTAALSRAFRRLTRPSGNVMQNFKLNVLKKDRKNIIELLNNGDITAAKPKQSPDGIISNNEIADQMTNKKSFFASLTKWIQNNFIISVIILIVLLLILLLVTKSVAAVAAVAGFFTIVLYLISRIKIVSDTAENLLSENFDPETIDKIPPNPAFTVTEPGASIPAAPSVFGGADSAEASGFRDALKDFFGLLGQPVLQPAEKFPLDINNAVSKINTAINPFTAFPKRFLPNLKIGNKTLEAIVPVMAYPDIKCPMYEPLRNISAEFLVPNLNLIPQNTISLLETNQPFIEAYMVGLNHEFARELLWREYPTDQRGSYFRQFWDVSKFINTDGLTEEELSEELKDITPIHTWSKRSDLGQHNNRETNGDVSQLVLVVRGDVLKKYPDTIIFAQKARWKEDSAQLEMDDSGGGGLDDTNILYPSYSANVNPDITFLGFDLTIEEARGDVQSETQEEKDRLGDSNLGWFFVLQEVVGEPRFGLDVTESENPSDATSWDELSWGHLGMETNCVDVDKNIKANIPGDIQWGNNSADMAYIFYQKPMMVAAHAREMLKSL